RLRLGRARHGGREERRGPARRSDRAEAAGVRVLRPPRRSADEPGARPRPSCPRSRGSCRRRRLPRLQAPRREGCRPPVTADRDVRALRYIQSRIGFIQRDLRQDPSALSEEGRTAGQSILWALMTLADSTTKLSDELKQRHPDIDWVAIRG